MRQVHKIMVQKYIFTWQFCTDCKNILLYNIHNYNAIKIIFQKSKKKILSVSKKVVSLHRINNKDRRQRDTNSHKENDKRN